MKRKGVFKPEVRLLLHRYAQRGVPSDAVGEIFSAMVKVLNVEVKDGIPSREMVQRSNVKIRMAGKFQLGEEIEQINHK